MLDNIADLLLTVSLLAAVFNFPTDFAIRYMVPGTAIGVLIGDLLFFTLAFRLAKKTGRDDITAMPLGLDTPSTFGMVFFVIGPAFAGRLNSGVTEFDAAKYAWQIGICSILISGIFKSICAFASNWIRRLVPRAGLLGSLTSVALVLISFLPLTEIMHAPVAGFVAIAIILTTLIGRVQLPWKIPGALGALLIAGLIYHFMSMTGLLHAGSPEINPRDALLPAGWTSVFQLEWLNVFRDSLNYLPIVLPFALATVIGGIDCTESASAAGDDFDTGQIIGVDAFATIMAALCGGVIQTTPYIGHPAYKAMGGRAAYTLAAALFVGSAGLLGFFGYLYIVIPKPAVFPVLIFIGLEIAAQSFSSTPTRHYKAVVFACVPALAYLSLIFTEQVIGLLPQGSSIEELNPKLYEQISVVRMLASGFILTSLLWSTALAAIIDQKLKAAGFCFSLAAVFTIFGIIHSPLPGSAAFFPWTLSQTELDPVARFAVGYLLAGALLFAIGKFYSPNASIETEGLEGND